MLRTPLAISLWVAGWACLFSLVAGTGIAWALTREHLRWRTLIEGLAMSPLVLPPTVLGYYLLVALGQQGIGPWVEAYLGFRFVFTLNGAIVAASISALPLVVQAVRASLAAISKEIEQAARLDGCSEWQLFVHVTAPLAWRGLLAGGILGFLRALGDFGAVLMVAGNIPGRTQTMAMAIYDAVQANRVAEANQLTLLLTVTAFSLLFLVLRISQRAFDDAR